MVSGPLRQRRKQARPQELLDAALALFTERGFAATRSEEVAARAGVSKGTLYLYYPSKEELLKAVIRHYLAAEVEAGRREVQNHRGDMRDVLLKVLPDWWHRVFDSPASAVFKLVFTEGRNFPDIAAYYADEVIEPGSSMIREVIERGIERGEFRPVDVENTVHSLVLPMVMLCLHKHSVGACANHMLRAPHRFIDDHMATMARGLAAEVSSAPEPRSSGRTAAKKK